jgi:hypothetical protein
MFLVNSFVINKSISKSRSKTVKWGSCLITVTATGCVSLWASQPAKAGNA